MVNFKPIEYGYIVRWQSDLVYTCTIECVLPVCDKPYHMNNGFQQMWTEIKKMWNHAFPMSIWERSYEVINTYVCNALKTGDM